MSAFALCRLKKKRTPHAHLVGPGSRSATEQSDRDHLIRRSVAGKTDATSGLLVDGTADGDECGGRQGDAKQGEAQQVGDCTGAPVVHQCPAATRLLQLQQSQLATRLSAGRQE